MESLAVWQSDLGGLSYALLLTSFNEDFSVGCGGVWWSCISLSGFSAGPADVPVCTIRSVDHLESCHPMVTPRLMVGKDKLFFNFSLFCFVFMVASSLARLGHIELVWLHMECLQWYRGWQKKPRKGKRLDIHTLIYSLHFFCIYVKSHHRWNHGRRLDLPTILSI